MRIRLALMVTIAGLLTVAGATVGANSPTTTPTPTPAPQTHTPTEGDTVLAEQLFAIGQQRLHVTPVTENLLLEAASLYRGAFRLVPTEPRFARALADTLLALHDDDDADAILVDYINLKPKDETAYVQRIDLRLAKYQNANDQIKYLEFVLGHTTIPKPVLSEAAYRLAKLQLNKSEYDLALKTIDSALVNNHLNMGAMRLKYSMLAPTATSFERVTELLNMLRANPADMWTLYHLAQELADQGLIELSLNDFRNAAQLTQAGQALPDPMFLRAYGCENIIAGEEDDGGKILQTYVAGASDDVDGWFALLSDLKVLDAGNPKDYDKLLADWTSATANAVANHLATVRQQIGDDKATTRPITDPAPTTLPDFSGDQALLTKSGDKQMAQSYLSAMISQAWFMIYFDRKPADVQPVLDTLTQVLPANDPQLIRLQGWEKYIKGDTAGAIDQLNTVADQDPLAEMGAILFTADDPKTHDQALVRAQRLLTKYPSGVIGATLATEFKKLGVKVTPLPSSVPLPQLINDFPAALMQMIATPGTCYSIHLEALQKSYEFGEPILARLNLTNIGSEDLAIGPDGAIHPEIWIDGFLAAQVGKSVPDVTTTHLTQRLLLPAGQSISTVVRLDSGLMLGVFNNNPQTDLFLNYSAMTNPVPFDLKGSGGMQDAHPGACGTNVWIANMVERHPAMINNTDGRTEMMLELNSGTSSQRMRAIESMALVSSMRNDPGLNNDTRTLAQDFYHKIHRIATGETAEKDDAVQIWAQYIDNQSLAASDRAAGLMAMLNDPSWETRLFGVVLSANAGINPKDTDGVKLANDLTQKGSTDPDAVVRNFARGVADDLAQASTQPASGTPTNAPQPMPTATPATLPAVSGQ